MLTPTLSFLLNIAGVKLSVTGSWVDLDGTLENTTLRLAAISRTRVYFQKRTGGKDAERSQGPGLETSVLSEGRTAAAFCPPAPFPSHRAPRGPGDRSGSEMGP